MPILSTKKKKELQCQIRLLNQYFLFGLFIESNGLLSAQDSASGT